MVLLVFVLYAIVFFIMLSGRERIVLPALGIAFCFHVGYFTYHLSVVLKTQF